MAKVTLRNSEAQAVGVDPAKKASSVVDSLGRTLKFREIDPLQESRLILAVGSTAAMNVAYLNAYVMPAAMVEYIDEDYHGCPQSQAQVDGMLKMLGREGMAAIVQHLQDQSTPDDEQAAAKN